MTGIYFYYLASLGGEGTVIRYTMPAYDPGFLNKIWASFNYIFYLNIFLIYPSINIKKKKNSYFKALNVVYWTKLLYSLLLAEENLFL